MYDIIDKQDHASIQAQLMQHVANENALSQEKRIFLCRMNVSRNSRRQMRFGDQKVCKLVVMEDSVEPMHWAGDS